MTTPTAHTKLLGVVGHPVDHSLSPVIHNAAIRHGGIDAAYLAFDIAPGELGPAVEGLTRLGAIGINVTIPHKLAALELASQRGSDAEIAGAANTLLLGAAGATAHNTDIAGVRRALEHHGLRAKGARCLLLGAGGAARAAGLALAQEVASTVLVCNRTREKAEELAARLGAETVAWEDRDDVARGADLIVNATSIGLSDEESPITAFALESAAAAGCRGVLDIVYGPSDTPLVRRAKDAGLPAADGLSMLVYQAAESFELFFSGRTAPVDVMMQAASRAAGRRPPPVPADAEGVPPLV